MTTLSACIEGYGLLGPGLSDWPTAAAVLTGTAPYRPERTVLPTAAALPSAERRRAGRVIKLALAVGAEALAQTRVDPRTLTSVFSSSGGDGDICHEICAALASPEPLISPTRFHNSVHNAAAGYWSIAYGCTEASTSLCGYDAGFGAGLIEAASQVAVNARRVLLIAYDTDYPQPLRAVRTIPDAFGVALLLAPPASTPALATLRIGLSRAAAASMHDAELEALRRSIPAARGLPLLQRLAQRRGGTVVLDYLGAVRLGVEVQA